MMTRLWTQALNLLVGDVSTIALSPLPQLSFLRRKKTPRTYTERDLIKMESIIGSQLFGEIPDGHRREFFNLDARTWIWHEAWLDSKRKPVSSTIRYEVHDKGIFKVQEGARYSYIEGDELEHFRTAVRMYYDQVARQVYGYNPETGLPLAAAQQTL